MYYHSQNLKREDKTKGLIDWRCWLRAEKFELSFSISIPSHFWHFHIDLCENGWQEEAIGFSVATPLCAIWLGLDNRWLYNKLDSITKRKDEKYTGGRTIGVSFHDGTFWFSLWETPMESRSVDPKWWHFNFNLRDFLLGRQKCSTEILEEADTFIDMPEGKYATKWTKERRTWRRPRSLSKLQRTSISFNIPVGIPHEGKGENSWDCGMDGTFGISTGDIPLHQATEEIAMRCLKTRQKYGSLNSPEYAKWKLEGEARVAKNEYFVRQGEI